MKSAETDDKTKIPATEESANQTVKDCNPSTHRSFFAQQYSSSEGGMPTDMCCPACGEEINGSHIPAGFHVSSLRNPDMAGRQGKCHPP
jgi:hypothetical protein